jgi:hypothetical protein
VARAWGGGRGSRARWMAVGARPAAGAASAQVREPVSACLRGGGHRQEQGSEGGRAAREGGRPVGEDVDEGGGAMEVGMKADRIISNNTFTTSASIFFSDVERSGYYTDAVTDAGFFRCRIWCGVGSVSERMWVNIVR